MLVANNLVVYPVQIRHISYYIVELGMSIINPTENSKCRIKHPNCYDYRSEGPINATCVVPRNFLICGGQDLRYPMQFNYWYLIF